MRTAELDKETIFEEGLQYKIIQTKKNSIWKFHKHYYRPIFPFRARLWGGVKIEDFFSANHPSRSRLWGGVKIEEYRGYRTTSRELMS